MQGALSLAHGAIIQAEALRLALVQAGVHYRALFAWLAVTVRRTSGEELTGCRNTFQTDAAALSDFINRQLIRDAIGPQLSQTVRCNPSLDVGYTAAGYDVTQHRLMWPKLPVLQALISSQKPVSRSVGARFRGPPPCPAEGCSAALRTARMPDAAHSFSSPEAGMLVCMQSWQHLARLQQLPEALISDVSSHDEAVVEPRPSSAQAPDAVDPLVAPSPGVAGLLRLFACDPGTTPLAARLTQLGLATEAVFAPIPKALAAEARLLADVPLATLPHGTPKPCMAFTDSQVRVRCLALASALLGLVPELRTVDTLCRSHSCQPLCGLSGMQSCVAPIAYSVRPVNELSRPHGLGGACRPRGRVSALGAGLPRASGSGSVACRRLGTQLCCA